MSYCHQFHRLHLRLAGHGVLLALGLTTLGAAEPVAKTAGGDELALFDDLPVVVSASRQETSVTRSSVPVSVLSKEDLSASGHYQIDEVLRFVPGMDARRVDRSRHAVGVRGFHGSFSDRTLTLVDGRTADSPVFGGAEWYRLPLMMDDIERIEVVRGPGGAAWGANAFNGVVNVITKDPEEMLGLHGSALVTGFGDSSSYARWAHAVGNVSWRIGAFYEKHVSSSDALDDDSIPDNDWGEKVGTDNALVVHLNDRTTVRAGVGYAKLDSGVFELIGYLPEGEDQLDTTRAYARFDQQASAEVSYRLGWYGNFLTSKRPAVFNERSMENAIEGQLDFSGITNHRLSIGGEWRMTDIEQFNDDPNQLDMVHEPYHEQRYGAFIIDQWQATERLMLEGQIRGDYYDGTGGDWAGRLAALYGIDQGQHHIARIAVARAYRTPLPALRDSSVSRPTLGIPILTTNLIAAEDLENEHTWALEAGYSADLPNDILLRVDGFYQQYEDLIGFTSTQTGGPLPTPVNVFVQADNLGGATAYGGEVELRWSPPVPWSDHRAQMSGWYSYHDLQLDADPMQDFRAWTPGKNKVGAGLRLPLPKRFSFTVNYAYTDGSVDPDDAVDAYIDEHHQLDLTLAWSIPGTYGELMIGGWDVLHEADDPLNGTGNYQSHETPGRTLFVRATLDF
jgi:outer membrane receptor protein involved in Fe transport